MNKNKKWIIIFILWTIIFCIFSVIVDLWYLRLLWCFVIAMNGFIIGVESLSVGDLDD